VESTIETSDNVGKDHATSWSLGTVTLGMTGTAEATPAKSAIAIDFIILCLVNEVPETYIFKWLKLLYLTILWTGETSSFYNKLI
jgi:hypothetical protein